MTALTPAPTRTPLENTARYGRLLRLCMGLYVLYAFAVMGLYKPITFFGVDYDKHWYAARAILEGKSCYFRGTLWMGFNYPQAAAIPFFWLGFFSIKTSQYLWKAVLLASIVATWWLARRSYRPQPAPAAPAISPASTADQVRQGIARHWGLVTALLTSIYFADSACVYLGNIDPLNGLLAVAMVAGVFSGLPLLAGVCWGLLTLIKMMPVVLIVPLLFWRQWRVLQGFLLAMAVYFLVLVALGRLGEEWYFVREAIPAIPVWWRCITISPLGFFLRLCGHQALFDEPRAFVALVRWCELVYVSLFLLLNLLMRLRRCGLVRALEVSIVFYPLLSPLLEYHHFVWIMPALFMQARRWAQGEMTPRMAVALGLAWVMLCAAFHVQDLMALKMPDLMHFAALPGYLAVLALTLADLFQSGMRNEVNRPCSGTAAR